MIPTAARYLPRILAILRTVAVMGVLLGGLYYFGKLVHGHYPIQKWMFFRYLGYWVGTTTLAVGWLGMGHLAVKRLFRVRLPLLSHLAVSLMVGVLAFQLEMFFLGVLQAYRPSVFFVAPLLPITLVAAPVYRDAERAVRRLRKLPRKPLGAGVFAVLFGMAGFAMVYFLLLTPDNVQFDARWKHMGLAEQFVVHGGIRRFPEGWVFAARPHFTSFLYAWAFLLPTGRLFDHMELCQHIEFMIFLLSTCLGVPALVRRLAPKADPRWIWAARFVFPGVFLYDSSLSGGADHVGAAFGIPIAILLLRVLREPRRGSVALLCAMLAGAGLVKETVGLLLIPLPLLALGIRLSLEIVRSLRGQSKLLRGEALSLPAVAVGAGLLFTAPLWLVNFIHYGDPFYPLLGRFLHPNPWSEVAAYRLSYGYIDGKMWAPTRDWDGVKKTLKTILTFSFVPNDWLAFHRDVPVFGSLYTLLSFTLPFLKKTKELWLFVLWIAMGIFAWYSVHHQDRYLQGITPVIVCVTAAILLKLWRSFGRPVRALVAAMVALQIVWGGDVYFIPTHVFAKSVIKRVVDLLGMGFEQKYDERLVVQKPLVEIGQALPPDGKLLVHLFHEQHIQLGIHREGIFDSYLWQFGIEYDRAEDPEGIRQIMKKLGATHVFAAPDHKADGAMSIAADIMFWDFLDRFLLERKKVETGLLGKLPDTPIQGKFGSRVAILTCHGIPRRGLFKLSDLRVLPYGPNADRMPEPLQVNDTDAALMLSAADFAVMDESCYKDKDHPKPTQLVTNFDAWLERQKNGKFPALQIWRKRL
jgi:hypothetical protein